MAFALEWPLLGDLLNTADFFSFFFVLRRSSSGAMVEENGKNWHNKEKERISRRTNFHFAWRSIESILSGCRNEWRLDRNKQSCKNWIDASYVNIIIIIRGKDKSTELKKWFYPQRAGATYVIFVCKIWTKAALHGTPRYSIEFKNSSTGKSMQQIVKRFAGICNIFFIIAINEQPKTKINENQPKITNYICISSKFFFFYNFGSNCLQLLRNHVIRVVTLIRPWLAYWLAWHWCSSSSALCYVYSVGKYLYSFV